jgi:FkbM family methyltransferase
LGGKSFVVIDKDRRADIWFSYRAQLMTLMERNLIDLVIDVGANEGQFGRTLRSFYSGKILSFEPVSEAFAKLADISGADPAWYIYQFALGSHNRTQTINVCNRTDLSSFLKPNQFCISRFGTNATNYIQEQIEVRRLDSALPSDVLGKNLFLKMDTQGYDLEVFKGAGDLLKHVRLLQSEVSVISIYGNMPNWLTSIASYENAGFQVVGMFPVCREAGRVVEFDCLFAKGV